AAVIAPVATRRVTMPLQVDGATALGDENSPLHSRPSALVMTALTPSTAAGLRRQPLQAIPGNDATANVQVDGSSFVPRSPFQQPEQSVMQQLDLLPPLAQDDDVDMAMSDP